MHEDVIKDLEAEIALKKTALKQLKKEKRNDQFFAETKFGKKFYTSLSTVLRPFVSFNEYIGRQLECPKSASFHKQLKNAVWLVAEAEITDEGTKEAHKIASKLAKLHVFLTNEKFSAFQELGEEVFETMNFEIARLRPPVTTEQQDQLNKTEEQINNLISSVTQTIEGCKNQND